MIETLFHAANLDSFTGNDLSAWRILHIEEKDERGT